METFRAERRHLSRTIEVDGPIEAVFDLLTPDGETKWVDGWQPQYLPQDADPRGAGTTFTTEHGAETTVWMVIEVDRTAHRSRYARHTVGNRIGLVDVRCRAVAADRTEVQVDYDMTGLSPDGNAAVLSFETEFHGAIGEWKPQMEAVLRKA